MEGLNDRANGPIKHHTHLVLVLAILLAWLGTPSSAWAQNLAPDGRAIERVSVSSTGAPGFGSSYFAGRTPERYISGDGRYVVFSSEANNLVEGDTNGRTDVFLRDRLAGKTIRLSVSDIGAQGNGDSELPVISADGRFVAFMSDASNLVQTDANGVRDVFLYDRDTDANGIFDEPGKTSLTRASLSSNGTESNCESARPSISADGRYIAFDSCATNWPEVAGKTPAVADVFVRDRLTGTTIWASPPTLGAPFNNGPSTSSSISGDGRYVAFESASQFQLASEAGINTGQIYVRDTCISALAGCTPKTDWASAPTTFFPFNNGSARRPSISADGNYVAYESDMDKMVPGDTNNASDIFVFDRRSHVTRRVSVSSAGVEGNTIGPSTCSKNSFHVSISGNGRLVTFESCASNLVADDNLPVNFSDIFVHDRDADGNGIYDEPGKISTILISRTPAGGPATGSSQHAAFSADGHVVAFVSFADDLTPTTVFSFPDIFAWTKTNQPPVANAGPDQTVPATSSAGAVVALDGSASRDPDGDALKFTWTGPFGTLTGAKVNPTLPAGTHTITLTVDDNHGGTATDTVVVTVTGAGPDLSITATAAPDPVDTGSNLTYSITITNAGPGGATGVKMDDTLPSSANFASVMPSQGTCTSPAVGATGAVSCDLGTISSGATATVSLVVKPAQKGPLSNTITVTANEPDPIAPNNTATVSTTVNQGPAVINVTENIKVTDAPGVLPSAMLTIPEQITVQDAPGVLPSAMLNVPEQITVTDAVTPLPSAMLNLAEQIHVVDSPTVGNTPPGTDVVVGLVDVNSGTTPLTVTFQTVTQGGATSLATSSAGPPPPAGFQPGTPPLYYDVTTTALYFGTVHVCINYAGIAFVSPLTVGLFHFENGVWVNRTVSVDATKQVACADVASLSPFALFERVDTTPPVITANISGTLGSNGWYKSDVLVSWSLTDPESAIGSSSGCGPNSVIADTPGTAFTCTATSAGGTASNSVTIKRDATPPNIAITTPASGAVYVLNQAVAASYSCTDNLSGVATCVGPVSTGANLDTATAGMKIFTVSSTDAAGNSNSQSVSYQVVCHYVTITLSPSSMPQGGTITVTGKLISCASTTQTVVIQFTLTGPSPRGGCGGTNSVMFMTPPITLPPNTLRTVSFPFRVPTGICPGTYSITATTLVGGKPVDTSSASLTVTPR